MVSAATAGRNARALRVLLACVAALGMARSAARAACPASPLAACRTAVNNTLVVLNSSSDSRDRFVWSWVRGPATSQSDFGNPLASTAYSLCVYDATGLVSAAEVSGGGACRGAPCWRTMGSSGYVYRDPAAATDGIALLQLVGSTRSAARVAVSARGVSLPDVALPLPAPLTVQLSRSDGAACFESVFTATDILRDDATQLRARSLLRASTRVPSLASVGCGTALTTYLPGTSTSAALTYGGLSRTFRVYVPPVYSASNDAPVPIVFLLHGGFGSGAQIETSSRMLAVADTENFIVVSPDGVAGPFGVRTWNAGGCCGYAVSSGADDVGFIASVLDHLEGTLCVDRRRVYAAGMSNGAMLSDRLACDLADRIRAIGDVSGANMTTQCSPARPVPIMHIHGTGDQNVPYDGGLGCGAAGVPFTSVTDTITGWMRRDGCSGRSSAVLTQGDGTCATQGTCTTGTDVELCTIPNGGHQWPGGVPPAITGIGACPFGYQSQSFSASQVLWDFFSRHPPR